MADNNVIKMPPQEPMLAAVGRGIQRFALVEMFMAQIHALLMYPAAFDVSMIAFDGARHLESKLRILRAIGPMRLDGPALKRFNHLVEKIKDRGGMRHKLAHWTTGYWHKDMPVEDAEGLRGMEVRLIPPYFSALNLNFSPKDSIRLEQIETFSEQCAELCDKLANFIMHLQGWLKEAEQRGDVRAGKISGKEISSAKS